MKSVLDACIHELGAPPSTFQRASAELFHPGRCAAIFLDARQLGYLGEIHPSVISGANLDGRLVAMEIDLEPVLAAPVTARPRPLPRFPAIAPHLTLLAQ